ncbi:ATP-binding protein [Brevibacterium sp. ZH18]|uniref:ATP-binding protein n=1 Tax=Brevibacterium sp. ZH18 TaxID=2927784 RepID=UPI001F6112FF|nr:ATP-binding protein [Brevibacterium sp. ZH18]MCI4011234.1 AAA family ATPase [Brevibacterium sp. ZH18]
MTEALFPLDAALIADQARARGANRPDVGSQWRLSEIQIANWGTFDADIHRIPISHKGHLITGPSGSGKSSLLDGIAAVLTPDKWLRFNVAAQTAGSRVDQRSLVSYVRGAWTRTTDSDEDRVVSKYLRPRATWSGIILRYDNGTDRPLSLARLFFVKGSGTRTTDLSDVCVLERAGLDLADLQQYALTGLETRKLKADHPEALITSNGAHGKFYARMRKVFGMASESALQLLHKTQSAKSLDSLDRLFRDHMLEPPVTFDLAETAVSQFGDLKDAHDHVVELRRQRDHLLQLREASNRYDSAHESAAKAIALNDALLPFQKRRELDLLRSDVSTQSRQLVELEVAADRAKKDFDVAVDEYDLARRATLELGGSEAEHLQQRIGTAETERRAVADRWASLERQLEQAGVEHAPASAAEFAELQAQIAATLDDETKDSGPSHADHDRFSKARQHVRELEAEIDSLRRSGSTVPGNLLQIRSELAEGIGLSEKALPFAAELIEVDPAHAEWTGAIERVLRPLALTVLVRSENLSTVRSWADAHRIKGRLVFEEIPAQPAKPRPVNSEKSLVNKVNVAESGFGDWVRSTLSERFDFACVEAPDELDDHPRAVTLKGQIKTSRTRYEKDDRRRIDDRSQWVLGNRENKLEALIDALKVAQSELAEAQSVVETATAESARAHRRKGILAGIREQSWRDVDREGAQEKIANLEKSLRELEDADGDLQQAIGAEREARAVKESAEATARESDYALRRANEVITALRASVTRLEDDVAAGRIAEVEPGIAEQLESRFRKVQRSITRESLPEIGQQVSQALQAEKDRAQSASSESGQAVTRLAAEFKAAWSSVASDLTADVADRRDFIAMLDEILAHGLPDHEDRFRDLLRQRSRDLIGELLNEIHAAPREIEDRVAPINSSLLRSQFDEDRYLRLKVKTRRSETVNVFIADLRKVAGGSWGEEDMETAEEKYGTLAEVMRRFSSSEHVDKVWKNQCLDTRLHVSFLAEEIDDHGRAHATYDSGAAMSGGQQQKLVIFCLAAALRYQLADPDEAISKYGTIILDEAFDKADTRYTRMALDIFIEFGFHMVLATPQKLLQTIEPYVGAATSIENPSRQKTVAATMVWETEDGGTAGAEAVETAASGSSDEEADSAADQKGTGDDE